MLGPGASGRFHHRWEVLFTESVLLRCAGAGFCSGVGGAGVLQVDTFTSALYRQRGCVSNHLKGAGIGSLWRTQLQLGHGQTACGIVNGGLVGLVC
jgi:hypothetical protein